MSATMPNFEFKWLALDKKVDKLVIENGPSLLRSSDRKRSTEF
jgi:hypothetical protein